MTELIAGVATGSFGETDEEHAESANVEMAIEADKKAARAFIEPPKM